MKQSSINPNGLYTLEEVGAITGAGYINVWRWAKKGVLRTTRFGNMHMVRGIDLLNTMHKWQRREIELDRPRVGSMNELVAAR